MGKRRGPHDLPFSRNHAVGQVGFEIIHHFRAVRRFKKRLAASLVVLLQAIGPVIRFHLDKGYEVNPQPRRLSRDQREIKDIVPLPALPR